MFKKTPDPVAEKLNAEINRLLVDMSTMDRRADAEYPKMVELLTSLMKSRNETAPSRMSADVKATIAANIAGIVILVTHERAHVVTSKALGFIQKLR